MNGYMQGAITGGIGDGINTAVSGIMNLYGMQRHFDLQQQNIDINNKYAEAYKQKAAMHVFGDASNWDPSILSQFHVQQDPENPAGLGPPQAMRIGMGVPSMTTSPYMRMGANALTPQSLP